MRMAGMSLAVRRRVVMVVISLGAATTGHAQEPYFPESIFFPKNKNQNSIVVDHLSAHLKAMKEPSLWKLSQEDRDATVHRFLWLASGQHPICVRLTRTGGTFTLHVARHDGPPGLAAGRMSLDKEVKLSPEQGERLIIQLQKTTFWTAPVEVRESRVIAGGDKIVIEGVKDGRYHLVDRVGPTAGESYKGFCRSVLELAGQPDVLKAWDHFRDGERKWPRYRPEPPQTADEGDSEADQESPEPCPRPGTE
jgi:hypothetical protein